MWGYQRMAAVFLGASLLSLSGGTSAEISCQQELARFNQTAAQTDLQSVRNALTQLDASKACGNAEKNRARRATASRVFRLAYQGSSSGMDEQQVDALVAESEAIAPTWRALSFAATRDHRRGHYVLASRRFQQSLALIDDEIETPKAPSTATIAQLHRLASESLLLADEFVGPPMVRGVSSGVLAAKVRGFSVRRAPLPISFETGNAEFTRQGKKAAEALLLALKTQGDSPVEIVGHADERGDDQYNYELSLKRAQRVRDWLGVHGVSREVRASGKGESEPMQLEDSSLYSQEQLWQLNRRVELVRLSAPN